ncbi:hypothetical protein [Christiangramia echinicola]|uniref:hypothetical protein n=1 Tax=Christiangramia echinicola TaxID=279359 RepID=UPI00040DD1E3|nr:hypothetical protein [Christiangramia echinicola]
MKKINLFLAYFAVMAMVLTGCSKDDPGTSNVPDSAETATLQLGPLLNDAETRAFLKQEEQDIPDCTGETPGFAQLSIIYGPDDTVKEDIIVAIKEDDQGLFTAYSEDLELPIPAGETTISVTLTEFVVWTNVGGNPGDVIWVAPIEGSDYADFVDQPVGANFTFDLRAGSKNYVNVDVICYDNRDVNLYGYQFFTITPIPLIEFCIFGNYCTPEGRHFVASYSVNVYESNDGVKGELIHALLNNVIGEGSDAYSDPLCFFVPDLPNVNDNDEEYYVEITLLSDTPGYNGPDIEIANGPISVAEIKLFFGDNGTLDYYHFQYGCEDGVPPPFGEPGTKRYKACIKYLDSDDDIAGFAYLSLDGTTLTASTSLVGLEQGEMHPQHIHENTSCGDYGPVAIPLDFADGTFPSADIVVGPSVFLNYSEVIPGVTLSNLQDRTVVIHGKVVDDEYVVGEPVACGELEEY